MDQIDALLAARASASSPVSSNIKYSEGPALNPDAPRIETNGVAQGPATGGDSIDALLAARAAATDADVAKPSAAKQQSMADQIAHQLGLTVRAGVTGLSGLPNMAGDALNSAINLGTSGINKLAGTSIPQLQLPSEATQQLMDKAGVSRPQNATERVVQGVASSMAGVNPSVGLGKVLSNTASPTAKAIGQALQASQGMQILGGAGAGAGAGIAAENGAGPVGQFAAGLAGGFAGAGLSSWIARLGQRGAPAATLINEQLAAMLNDPGKPRIKLNIDGTTQPAVTNPLATALTEKTAPFAAVEPASTNTVLPTPDQNGRIDLMRKIGLDTQRPSAISGNPFAAGLEFENGKLNNPTGEVARGQLQKEQSALKNYAGNIIAETGASANAPEAVGQTVRAPLQGLSDYFDKAIGKLYDAAKQKAGAMGAVSPDNLNNIINNNDFRESLLSSPAGTTLLGSIERQVKRFQGVPVEGEPVAPAPNTVNSAENLRKWLNSQWSPGNSKLLGQVKESLDSDVANAGGSGLFDEARKLHMERKNTLDNPNGISALMHSEGPNGINQAVPDEKVAEKLLKMPTNQFAHIVNTLKTLPAELQGHGQAALAEIKGALAKKIYEAGDSGGTQNGPSVWNAANVTRALNTHASKLSIMFGPDGMEKFKTLNDAGHVLQTPMAYKGAAAQGYNYLQSGVLTGLPAAGAGIGGWLGGAPGAVVGSGLGGMATSAVKSRMDATMAAKLAEVLRNPNVQTVPK